MLGVMVSCGGEVFICGVGGNVGWCVVVVMEDGVVSGVAVVVGGWLIGLYLFVERFVVG